MINHKIPITTAAMLLAMILFLKFGFSFLSQIPFLMHPTVRYKARHINTIHSPERSCLLSFPMAIWSVLQPAIPRKPASIHCAQSSEVSVPVIHPDYFSFSSSSHPLCSNVFQVGSLQSLEYCEILVVFPYHFQVLL